MQRFKNFLSSLTAERWRLFVTIICAVVLIITVVTTVVVINSNKKEVEKVTAYLTVQGLGEDVDFENRVIKIVEDDTVMQIFRYEEYAEQFGKLRFHKNELVMFMDVKAENSKGFHVQIDGIDDNNLDQAYVSEGQTITIKYY